MFGLGSLFGTLEPTYGAADTHLNRPFNNDRTKIKKEVHPCSMYFLYHHHSKMVVRLKDFYLIFQTLCIKISSYK